MVYLVQYISIFHIYGIFGTVYEYILYRLSSTGFEIYGIFGAVYQYIWYRLSSTALKYMVYLVQYISIFHIYGIFGTVYQYISCH